MHKEGDSEVTGLQLSLDPISLATILTHANVYFEIVLVSFVTDNTAAKSVSQIEHLCKV